jgi:hypothetical protein
MSRRWQSSTARNDILSPFLGGDILPKTRRDAADIAEFLGHLFGLPAVPVNYQDTVPLTCK